MYVSPAIKVDKKSKGHTTALRRSEKHAPRDASNILNSPIQNPTGACLGQRYLIDIICIPGIHYIIPGVIYYIIYALMYIDKHALISVVAMLNGSARTSVPPNPLRQNRYLCVNPQPHANTKKEQHSSTSSRKRIPRPRHIASQFSVSSAAV